MSILLSFLAYPSVRLSVRPSVDNLPRVQHHKNAQSFVFCDIMLRLSKDIGAREVKLPVGVALKQCYYTEYSELDKLLTEVWTAECDDLRVVVIDTWFKQNKTFLQKPSHL